MNPPPRHATWLGYAGLLPFVGLAAAANLAPPPWAAHATTGLLAYGTSILSFMGAIHWGLAMRGGEDMPQSVANMRLLWGVTPSLVAWIAAMLGAAAGLWLIVGGLWACYAVDRRVYLVYGLRDWLPMRLVLTWGATLSCGLAAGRLLL